MKKALIIYNSRTGITKRFGEEIKDYLNQNGIDTKVLSIDDYTAEELNNSDYLLLGTWTHGLMIFLQHPDKKWVEFANKLPDLTGKILGLFTTYKIATGPLFKKMRGQIKCAPSDIAFEIKSRNGHINESHKIALNVLAVH